MELQKCVVLFLDILGYSSLISECSSIEAEQYYLDKIRKIMTELSGYIEQRNHKIDQNVCNLKLSRLKSLLFSDNILFFTPYNDDVDLDNQYINLFYGLSEFLLQYDKEDIFFRGGVAKGNLFYDEENHFVFGSGLVKAAKMEEKAKYPRIAIDNELSPSPILSGIEKDSDGIWYFDYLSLAYNRMDKQNYSQQLHNFLFHIERQKLAIINAIQKNKGNDHVFKKYKWLAEYHNSFCERHNFKSYMIEDVFLQ